MIAADATTLVALSLAGHAHLINKLLGKVTITDSTEREIKAVLAALKPDCAPPGEDTVEVASVDFGTPALSRSESETIVLARQKGAKLILTDDLVVRDAVREEGIKVVGTAGLLYAACARGLIKDVSAVIAQMRSAGYSLSDECARTLLARTAAGGAGGAVEP
jgi:predicted nucleic acid-binding protein